MNECVNLGLERCHACRITSMACSVIWYRLRIEKMGLAAALQHVPVPSSDPPMYFYAAVKYYYPQYEHLLVLV